MNLKKLHQAVNLRKDWSGFLLSTIPNFFFFSACILGNQPSNELCMTQTKCSWITTRVLFCLVEREAELFQWATERKLNPKLEEYEHEQLDEMLQIFYTEIRTKHGFEYEPESLKSMLAALDCYLKEHDYKHSIIRDREFRESKLVLEGKVKCLRQQGKGKRPNAALTTEEEEMLWSKQSLGNCSPRVLSQTMWWILTQHFGLREHHSTEVEDFSFVWTTVALSTSHLKKILQRRGRAD